MRHKLQKQQPHTQHSAKYRHSYMVSRAITGQEGSAKTLDPPQTPESESPASHPDSILQVDHRERAGWLASPYNTGSAPYRTERLGRIVGPNTPRPLGQHHLRPHPLPHPLSSPCSTLYHQGEDSGVCGPAPSRLSNSLVHQAVKMLNFPTLTVLLYDFSYLISTSLYIFCALCGHNS